jgi:hypothetical protein
LYAQVRDTKSAYIPGKDGYWKGCENVRDKDSWWSTAMNRKEWRQLLREARTLTEL